VLTAALEFPPLSAAWGPDSPAPGLLAVGGDLSVARLRAAYARGIFPWYSEGQPTLWWSPDPRMVLVPDRFALRDSLRKKIRALRRTGRLDVRIDTSFTDVMRACAAAPRPGQRGTWIQPEMVEAYVALHRAGLAHSVEAWIDGELAGGLYCVALGKAVFGESMFHRVTDASKIALAALVAFCAEHGVEMIDCQMNTEHLASLGGAEVERAVFAQSVERNCLVDALPWTSKSRLDRSLAPVYWKRMIERPAPP
jgi:leucyl/phenylalanyl-tRNA---protein transferase